MPLYVPWLTETIKKRGVRYLLHHYLGQFFEEDLTLDQLSIDIYEGKGSIKDLSLDVDGLNDELDFVPFRFLEGCQIGQISVEVPWSTLATEACQVELKDAKFFCRLKTTADATKTHCTESTLLSRSLMTSSMQMAEEIVSTEDDDEYDLPEASNQDAQPHGSDSQSKKKNVGQMFEGLEMFAQLIDSVLRRIKLTARNTLFQIQPRKTCPPGNTKAGSDTKSSEDEFSEPLARSNASSDSGSTNQTDRLSQGENLFEGTVEFFIRFFQCEEIVDQDGVYEETNQQRDCQSRFKTPIPGSVTKLLTLEDVEMRIDGIPVSNLVGKHTITIKFNGHKSEISIFSGAPLLAVIGQKQLETFFNIFDNDEECDFDMDSSLADTDQKMMNSEDYAKIENQLLETASLSGTLNKPNPRNTSDSNSTTGTSPYYVSSAADVGGRRWVETGAIGDVNSGYAQSSHSGFTRTRYASDCGDYYHASNASNISSEEKNSHQRDSESSKVTNEPTLDNIEAFSCELKLPGIWLCILRDGEQLPLIKPYASSMNSFKSINKYIDEHIKVPHIRCLALKVALDITATTGMNIYLGDFDISEHLTGDETRVSPILKLLQNDAGSNTPMSTSPYKASIVNGKDINIELMTSTRMIFDPTIIDRIVYDYKLIRLHKVRTFEQNRASCSDDESYYTGNRQTRKRPGEPLTTTDRRQSHRASGSLTNRSINQRSNNPIDFSLHVRGEKVKIELLCPIPDLTPGAHLKPVQLRPQSFIFDFKSMTLSWQSDKLNMSTNELKAYVKMQPKQSDNEAVKFIESVSKGNDRITLTLEPSPSNLDNAFTSDIERALNESTLYDSIYVGQAIESRIPTSPFQTKRKVVRPQQPTNRTSGLNKPVVNDFDHERIITPGDRQHLLDYLNQTLMSTKLSLKLHLPICEVEFEDKEQLDLIYNRFCNDFVFWQPKTFTQKNTLEVEINYKKARNHEKFRQGRDKQPTQVWSLFNQDDSSANSSDEDESDSDSSFHSMTFKSKSRVSDSPTASDCYDNNVTCMVQVDELLVRFNHQSCAAALKQEIAADNLLMGIVIDVNKKPNTLLSLVVDHLELSNDSMQTAVLEGNFFTDKKSIFAMAVEIVKPTKDLKDIKLAIQLSDGLFKDFKSETYSRFWQSINVTDEPILGYQAPQILTEFHVDILNTSLMLVEPGARPSLVSVDELYLTSMVMQQTSQVMIRMIADEVALYMKRDKQGLEQMKNYICLIDSGLIDLDVKFSKDGQLEFNVINNVITVRVCQDSLSALCKLFDVLIRLNSQRINEQEEDDIFNSIGHTCAQRVRESLEDDDGSLEQRQEMNLLEDAMNDYAEYSSSRSNEGADGDSVLYSSSSSDRIADGQSQSADDQDYDERDYSGEDGGSDISPCRRSPTNTCLLDESNPMLGDLFSQPLVPTNLSQEAEGESAIKSSAKSEQQPQSRAMDESGFFVIGDDDVGAGIIDKNQQHEPVVRKLIDGPITMIENHFKMTKPRTLPKMLANSLERYVLEEMTLVVNLFGGRDFDDQNDDDDNKNGDAFEFDGTGRAETGDCGASSRPAEASGENTTLITSKTEGILLKSISHELDDAVESLRNHNNSLACRSSIRGRAASLAATSPGTRHSYGDPGGSSGSLKRRSRRKHMSESRGTASGAKPEGAIEQRVRFGEGAVNLWESLDLMSSPDFLSTARPPLSSDSKHAGGPWRQNDVCIQLSLSKVKMLFEVTDVSSTSAKMASANQKVAGSARGLPSAAPTVATTTSSSAGCQQPGSGSAGAPVSWRFTLFVQDIEVKDKIAASDINKILYEYSSESMPKRSTQFLTIRNVATINQSDGCEECDLCVSLKPLRLNIDQDTLLFLIEFYTAFTNSLVSQRTAHNNASSCQQSNPTSAPTSQSKSHLQTAPTAQPQPQPQQQHQQQKQRTQQQRQQQQQPSSANVPANNHHVAERQTANQQPIYIRSFTFSPSVPIRIDYHAKHLDFEQGALAGILMGLTHLDHSELVLRRVQAKHGMRGIDRVFLFALNSWLNDIKRNQLPNILGGVGPMHSVIQLFQGMRDLIWMPIDHYRKDGRLVRGLQRGASSFSSSTAMAAISLVSRFISIVQCTAQIAYDIVTPPSANLAMLGDARLASSGSQRCHRHRHRHHHQRHRATSNTKLSSGAGSTRATQSSLSSAVATRRFHHNLGAGSGSASGPRLRLAGPSSSFAAHNCGASSAAGSAAAVDEQRLNQPRNFCEGVAVGFSIIREGFNDTARNVTVGMQAEDMRSAMGELVRQIPSTLLNPIISATEGAQSVLVGIRNQIAPDARREDQDKWKGRLRGK